MKQKYFVLLRLLECVLIITLVSGCVGNIHTTNLPPVTITQPVTPIVSSTSTVEPSLTANSTATLVDTKPVWEIKENWTLANQIRTMLIDQNGDLWTGGPAGVVHWDLDTNTPTVYAIYGDSENSNVLNLSQTPDGSIWVGTFGNGFARFDGKSWVSFTTADGVPGNFIIAQTVTSFGELWFTTQKDRYSMEDSHFGRFDGNKWIIEYGGAFDRLITLLDDLIVSTYNYPYHGGFFNSTIAIYDGHAWGDLGVDPDGWIDAVTVAPNGTIWFATNSTVYRGENQTWLEITSPWGMEKGGQRVSSITVLDNGVAWLGTSFHTGFDLDRCGYRRDDQDEYGVYRYDGENWTHFTTEDGLIDNKICAITVDANNNIWFGPYDKGVSRFDGKTWTSYVVP